MWPQYYNTPFVHVSFCFQGTSRTSPTRNCRVARIPRPDPFVPPPPPPSSMLVLLSEIQIETKQHCKVQTLKTEAHSPLWFLPTEFATKGYFNRVEIRTRNRMGKRKERRLAAMSNAGRRVKLDLFAEPSGIPSLL